MIDDIQTTERLVSKRVDARLQTPDDETQMTLDDETTRLVRINEMRAGVIALLRLLSSTDRFEKFLLKWFIEQS